MNRALQKQQTDIPRARHANWIMVFIGRVSIINNMPAGEGWGLEISEQDWDRLNFRPRRGALL